MKAFLCEFAWQANGLSGYAPEETVVLSATPRASQALEVAGIPYVEISNFCDHEELWPRYREFTERTFTLTQALDELLMECDPRFQNSGLKIFDGLHYILKICHDQITYCVHLLNTLFAQKKIDEVFCADNGQIRFDDCGLFHNKTCLWPRILRCFQSRFNFCLTMQSVNGEHGPARTAFSFGQPLRTLGRMSALGAANAFRILGVKLVRPMSQRRVLLSVGCKEADTLFREQEVPGWKLVRYSYQVDLGPGGRTWPAREVFLAKAEADPRVRASCVHDGMDFWSVFSSVVSFFAQRMEAFLAQQDRIWRTLDRLKPDCAVFQTLAPVYPPNPIIKGWCESRDVPYFCWMHGGYGAYWSLPGYDVVDWRLCKRHLAYGKVIGDLVSDRRCVTRELGLAGPEQVEAMGSPFFNRLYRGYDRPNNAIKRIMFAIGNKTVPNSFYFGYNRPETEMSIWRQHRAILEILAAYQDRYVIILKDYPHSWDKGLWRSVLYDLGADRIRYVCEEEGFAQVMTSCDLHIYTWISTTFFQSLHTEADILVFDDSDMTEASADMLARDIGLGRSLPEFSTLLRGYLDQGEFYTQDKTALRSYFLDYENSAQRGHDLAKAINKAFRRDQHARI